MNKDNKSALITQHLALAHGEQSEAHWLGGITDV